MNTQNTNTQYQKRDWDNQEAGVIWKRKTKSGQDMLTGKVTVNGELFEFVCFTNKNKYSKDTGELIPGTEKQPDFRIYPSEKREVTPTAAVVVAASKTTTPPVAKKQYTKPAAPPVEVGDGEIL